jgi:GNAT superfamily N-acetyltransferase
VPTSVDLLRPRAEELLALFHAAGWGGDSCATLEASIAAYPCTVCARDNEGQLVGYLSAFSDEVMSTLLGELVVHPAWRRQGIASSLLTALEARYPRAPIYVKALGDSKHFYKTAGFKVPSAEFTVMFKRPDAPECS